MGLRVKNGKWEYRFVVSGQPIQVATGLAATERNRKKAEQLELAHRQGILEGRWGPKPLIPRLFSDLLPGFLAFCVTQYAQHPNSAKRIRVSMASCKEFFGQMIVSMIAPAEVEQYKAWRLNEHGVKPVTVKHDLDGLSVFFQWAVKQNYARQNPVAEVTKPSDVDAVRQYVLTAAEERLYFTHARGNLRDVARLMILQGARPEECMSLSKQDIDFERQTIQIRGGKSKAAKRTLRATSESLSILAGRMGTAGPWVFPSDKRLGRHITKLNCSHNRVIDALNPCRNCCARESEHPTNTCLVYVVPEKPLLFVLYDLRHTFATRLAQAGVDAFTIAAILGHSSTRVLNRYIHPTQAHQDEAMAVYERSLQSLPVGRA